MTANPAERLADAGPPRQDMSLLRWVWRTYVRNALVPLLVVELLLVAVYLASHAWSLRKNVAALSEVARQELSRIADDESAVIEQQLGQVASLAEVLRLQTTAALGRPAPRSPGPRPPAAAAERGAHDLVRRRWRGGLLVVAHQARPCRVRPARAARDGRSACCAT